MFLQCESIFSKLSPFLPRVKEKIMFDLRNAPFLSEIRLKPSVLEVS